MSYVLFDVICHYCNNSFKILKVKDRNFCKLACREAFYKTTSEPDPDGEIDWRRVMYNAPLKASKPDVAQMPDVVTVGGNQILNLPDAEDQE